VREYDGEEAVTHLEIRTPYKVFIYARDTYTLSGGGILIFLVRVIVYSSGCAS